MNPKGIVTPEDAALIHEARRAKETADANWRAVVLAVAERSGSIRETAKVADISPETIRKWKKHN